jgi:hypothetical protein
VSPPDLVVTSVDAVESGTYRPGDQIQVNYVMWNAGGQTSNSFTVDFYASTNTTITTSDYKIGSATYSGVQAGWTFSGADICQFPPNSFNSNPIPLGDYYIGIIVTCSNDSNPANNTGYDSDPVTVTAPVNLLDAVDASGFSVITTGTSAKWFGQTTTYYYGGDAAQSADISDNGESYMYITVTGPGTIQFYWKVSSEANYDYLQFYNDSTILEQISGTVDWTSKQFSIGSGSHTLKWRYMKDGSVSSGSDCGWVDYVRWVAAPPPDIRIEPTTLNFEASATSGGGDKAASSGESFDEYTTQKVEQDAQSTTGPVPPESVLERDREEMKRLKSLTLEEKEQLLATQHTISGVPEYFWRHGCGPTSVGMVIGYYDVYGYSDLISGNASTQTADVNQAITSGGDASNPNPPGSERHYEDYSRPEDDTTPNMITDDYITKGHPAHADDCIGDYMDTSKSTRNNRYGWSRSSDIGPSYIDYVNQQDSSYNPSYTQYTWSGGTLTWDVLKN